MNIAISGSLAYDFIMDFPDEFKNHIMPDSLHILNVCFMIDKLNKSWGGTAGNIAYTMKLLEQEPLMLSALGKDASEYMAHFEKNNLSTKYIIKDKDQFTSSAHITTDKADNQLTAFYNGPLERSLEQNIKDIEEKVNLVIVSPTQKEVMIKHLKEAHELGLETVFDPGQQITAFSEIELKKMIGQADFLTGNDYEIKLISKKTGWSLEEILKYVKVLVITLGSRGSIIRAGDETVEVGICSPQSVDDPTGAGDAYRAGFFSGYVSGYDFKKCGQMGSVASSYAIENYGTQAHGFTKTDFEERYKKAFNEEIKF